MDINKLTQQEINTATTISRRSLIKQIAILTGGVVMGAEMFMSTGCKTSSVAKGILSESNIALLNEIGETIIPKTDTPGAKEAKVADFMNAIVSDCYTPEQQKAFTDGITTFEKLSTTVNKKAFAECTATQKHDLLISLEKEAKEFDKKVAEEEAKQNITKEKKSWNGSVDTEGLPRHYYTMMKQLTLWGFFTSKEGMTKTLRYNPVPGKYDGSFPYKKGDKAWA
jgi:Gluconate 2-dehydrogenase subunit 3